MKRENPLFISATLLACSNLLMPSITATASHPARYEADALWPVEQVPARTSPPHREHVPVVPIEVPQQRPGVVECEPNEGEETCHDGYVDNCNGGCDSDPPVFQLIECGQTICGTSRVYVCDGSTYHDMDWFEVTLDTAAQITWAGEAEFPVAMWILSGDCNDIVVEEYATAAECTLLSLSHACDAGLYMLVIAPADWGDYACGVKYKATVTCDVFTGACCNGPDCLGTMTELECDALNGDFYLGESCATFECPWGCPESMLDIAILTDAWGEETTWEITVHGTSDVICSGGPYEDETLYNEHCCIAYDGCVDFTIYDSYGDGIYAPGGYTVILDGEVIYDCMGEGWYGYSQTVANFGGGCVPDPGACCDADLNCTGTNTEDECDALDGDWHIFEDCDAGYECLPRCYDCPSNGMPEGEPVCEDDYVDNYNGGCGSNPVVFQDILCDEVICGESGTFYYGTSSYRDTDWFRAVVDEATTLTWSVCAEFEVLIVVLDGGSENCLDCEILGFATAPAEETATLSFDVGPGAYWLWVGPSVFTGVPCGSQYTGTVTGVAPCICGDFDNDDDVDVDDFYFLLDAFGTCAGDQGYEEDCDFDGDECVTLVDYQMWTQCYREANGKGFVAPTSGDNAAHRPGGQMNAVRP